MKRFAALLVATLLVGGLGPPAGAQIKPVGPGTVEFTTKDDINFRFGISLDWQPMTIRDLDFNDKTNFRTITEFGVLGEEDSLIGFENRLFFTATKGRVSLYTAFELDGVMDERAIDTNNPNIERINLSLLMPEWNTTFTVGADIYGVDFIGGLVYIDDDPGVWFKGGAGPWSWQAGWHKRQEFGGGAGDGGVRFPSRVGPFEDREDDGNILSGKIGYNVKHAAGSFLFSPFVLAYLRDQPYTGSGLTRLGTLGPGGATRPADPLQASIANVVPHQDTYYLGLEGTGSFGVLRPSFEFVYLTGSVSGLRDRTTGGLPFGFDSFDVNSWAAYLRLDFDVSKQPWWPLRGVIPFVSVEYLSGDDDPFDDELKGFVSPSTPNGLRRGDFPFLRKTVMSLGSPPVGDGTANFGFAVDGRGIGPSIGNILENATVASPVTFNNRWGKGDNPGYTKVAGGLQGSLNPKWELHLAGSWYRFNETEPIEAEFRALNIGSVNDNIGAGIDVVVAYKPQPPYQVRPFFSIFFPGSGVEKIAGSDDEAVVAGVNFFAMF